MDITEIQKLLPHRYPFLLVDRVTRVDDKAIEACKNVTINEPFFGGHFPGNPIMPGVLVIEALAQVGGLLLLASHPELRNRTPLFLGIERARFRRQIRPGDVLAMTCEIISRKLMLWKMKAIARVGSDVVCDAELLVGFEREGAEKN